MISNLVWSCLLAGAIGTQETIISQGACGGVVWDHVWFGGFAAAGKIDLGSPMAWWMRAPAQGAFCIHLEKDLLLELEPNLPFLNDSLTILQLLGLVAIQSPCQMTRSFTMLSPEDFLVSSSDVDRCNTASISPEMAVSLPATIPSPSAHWRTRHPLP
ncbi:hypothetical protein V6N11_003888 [Hibiscus sabdariffa]|uniref:Uncharacterized protein n=1 Tax=Hibiscus sabdariffa TaxID=183260 RepID=A0ABR2SEJ2_9ROSI